MINLNEQCLKSVVNLSEAVTRADNNLSKNSINATLSKHLSYIGSDGRAILMLIEKSIDIQLLRTILDDLYNEDDSSKISLLLVDEYSRKVSAKDYNSIVDDSMILKYKLSFISYDKSDYDDYSFFGTTKCKLPILLHKSFIDADIVLSICNVKYNNLYGVKTAKHLIAYGLLSAKADRKLLDIILDRDYKKVSDSFGFGMVKDNMLDAIATEICLIARSDVEYFALNYTTDIKGDIDYINSGDVMLSHIEVATQYMRENATDFKKYQNISTLIITLDNGSFEENISSIRSVAKILGYGKHILIDASSLDDIGSDEFKKYIYFTDRADIIYAMDNDYSLSKLNALELKYLTSIYNISIATSMNDEILRASGLNMINLDGIICCRGNESTAEVSHADRFAI